MHRKVHHLAVEMLGLKDPGELHRDLYYLLKKADDLYRKARPSSRRCSAQVVAALVAQWQLREEMKLK